MLKFYVFISSMDASDIMKWFLFKIIIFLSLSKEKIQNFVNFLIFEN